MKDVPAEFKKLADSAELYDQSELVGSKFNLHINQIGEMDAEIRDVLSGVSDAENFVSRLATRLEIKRDLAEQIVTEINKQVFDTIRSQLKSAASVAANASAVSSVERAGGFTIEKGSGSSEAARTGQSEVTAGDRSALLKGLEDPEPPQEKRVEKVGQKNSQSAGSNHVEPLVDYLLGTSVSQVTKKVEVEPPANLPVDPTSAPTASTITGNPTTPQIPRPAPTPRTGPDPYRETLDI